MQVLEAAKLAALKAQQKRMSESDFKSYCNKKFAWQLSAVWAVNGIQQAACLKLGEDESSNSPPERPAGVALTKRDILANAASNRIESWLAQSTANAQAMQETEHKRLELDREVAKQQTERHKAQFTLQLMQLRVQLASTPQERREISQDIKKLLDQNKLDV